MAAGDAGAKAGLAALYANGIGVEQDIPKAVALYQEVLADGNAWAASPLAALYLKGEDAGLDVSKALDYYEQGAAAGDAGAMAGLAALYRDGKLVAKDAQKSVDLYARALQAGRMDAAARLGDLHRQGQAFGLDPAKAIDFYQQGVEAGDAGAMVGLANLYRDGKLVGRDVARAADLYQQAYLAGRKDALANAIGALLSGTPAQQAQAHALIAKGQAENAPNIASALANAMLNGTGIARNPAGAVGVLKAASAKGDAHAASMLIQLYMQGRGDDIRRDIPLARATLASVADLIPQEERQREELLIEASTASSVEDYRIFTQKTESLQPAARATLVSRLAGANGNAYVYVLQSGLKDAGLYDGQLNGFLTSQTIRAFNRFCGQRDMEEPCRTGPLSWPARNVFVDFMRETGS